MFCLSFGKLYEQILVLEIEINWKEDKSKIINERVRWFYEIYYRRFGNE